MKRLQAESELTREVVSAYKQAPDKKSADEWMTIAHQLQELYGQVPSCTWLRDNGFNAVADDETPVLYVPGDPPGQGTLELGRLGGDC